MRAPRFQMSLRFLLVGVTLVCIDLNIVAERARRQRELLRRLEEVGAAVLFDYQRLGDSGDSDFNPRAGPPAPEWLRRLLGEEFFRTVVYINMTGKEVCDDCWAVLRLGDSIECLILDSSSIGDAAMEDIAQCRRLTALSLGHGAQLWQLIVFGLAASAVGIGLWHGLGRSFGLGKSPAAIENQSLIAATLVLAGWIALYLVAATVLA